MTTEEKAALIEHARKHIEHNQRRASAGYPWDKLNEAVYRIALSALTAEPVAVPDEFLDATQNDKGLFELSEDCMVRLAVALSQQQKGLVIKPGWRLVPVIAFPSQWAAGQKAFDATGINKVDAVYRAMLAAAPTP